MSWTLPRIIHSCPASSTFKCYPIEPSLHFVVISVDLSMIGLRNHYILYGLLSGNLVSWESKTIMYDAVRDRAAP